MELISLGYLILKRVLKTGVAHLYLASFFLLSACTLETTLAPTEEAFQLNFTPTFSAVISNNTTQTFTFSDKNIGANIVRYECSLDNAEWATCESPITVSSLSEGRHSFSVKGIGADGQEFVGAQHEWSVDTTAPVLSIDSPATDAELLALDLNQTFTLSGACSEEGRVITITGAALGVTTCANGAWSVQLDVAIPADGTLSFTANQSDIAGNYFDITRSAVKDTTAPTVSWTSPATDLQGASNVTVTWKITELHATNTKSMVLEYSGDGGVTWTQLNSQTSPDGSITNQAFNYSWTTPNSTVASAVLRLTFEDKLGNQAQSTHNFAIDTAAPVLNSVILAEGNDNVGISSIGATLSVTPSVSAIAYFRLSEDINFADTAWMAYTTPNLTFSLSKIGSALKTVYAQVKSSAGIVSNIVSDTVTLEYGTPPIAVVTAPVAGGTYSPGNTMTIAWQCESSSGTVALAANPISSIEYTVDDGVTYHVIATNRTNNDTATTGHYDWTVPATTPTGQTISSTVPIRVLVGCKTTAGVITTGLSNLQNSFWKVLIGNPANLDYGVHLSAADMSTWTAVHGDSLSNLYVGNKHAILKVNRQSGIVEQWLGSLETPGCPTNTVASFNRPRILDITNDEMTLVSGICGTITKIKISDKSILWSRSIANLTWSASQTSTEGFYHKSGYYYFPTIDSTGVVTAIYEINLNSSTSTPKLIMGTPGTCSAALPAVGVDASITAIPCTTDTNWWNVSPDRQTIWVYKFNGTTTTQVALTYNSTTTHYEVSSTGTTSAPCTRTVMVGNDTSKYFCIRSTGQGRNVTTFDTTTGAPGGTYVTLSTFNNLSSMQLRLGASDNALYVSSSVTNELFEVKFNGTSWVQSTVGGTPFFTYGNGTDPTKVAFTSIAGLAYDPVNKYLYTRGINHLRRMKVDTTGTPYISLIETGMNTSPALGNSSAFGGVAVDKTGNSVIVNQSSSPFYLWKTLNITTWNSTAQTVGAGTTYYGGGTTDPYPALGATFAYNAPVHLQDWGSTGTFLSDGKFYFVGSSNSTWNQDLYIFQSTSNSTITSVAGATGAAGFSSIAPTGATAIGTPLTRIYGMQSSPTNDLLIFDAHRLRRISVVTESAGPKIYDVIDFSTFTNYPGDLPWLSAVYDSATGWSYFVVNEDTSIGRATQVWAARATEGFVQISTAGLSLTGVASASRGKGLSLEISPLGLLMLDQAKKRVLVTPLKPL